MVKTHEKSWIRLTTKGAVNSCEDDGLVILQLEEFENWYVVELVKKEDYMTEDTDDLKQKLEFLEEKNNRSRGEYNRLMEKYLRLQVENENRCNFIKELLNVENLPDKIFDLISLYFG